jgi:hypothetical protein
MRVIFRFADTALAPPAIGVMVSAVELPGGFIIEIVLFTVVVVTKDMPTN